MKSILSITTVILALLFCTTTMAEEVQPLTSGDYQYIVLEDNTAEITKYIGKAEALTVKDTLDGLTVTSIGDEAFSNCPNLTLTVPRDSYAKQYCIDNNLLYTYPDALDWLSN